MNPPITWMRLQRDGLPPTLPKVGQKSADFCRNSVHFVNDLVEHLSLQWSHNSQIPATQLQVCRLQAVCLQNKRVLKSIGTLYIQASDIIKWRNNREVPFNFKSYVDLADLRFSDPLNHSELWPRYFASGHTWPSAFGWASLFPGFWNLCGLEELKVLAVRQC